MRTPSSVVQYLISRSPIPPPHLIQPHRLLEPLRHEFPAVREEEVFAAAQPANRIRHEYLPALCLRRDPRRQDHRRAEEVAVFLERLTGVHADAHSKSLALACCARSLQGDCALS